MDDPSLILQVVFYQSENNKEPVREWLKSLSQGISHKLTKKSFCQ
jgi:DNA-dependent RNA polymerase auxiliary subunit epsilon